jgi:hypothetical protein
VLLASAPKKNTDFSDPQVRVNQVDKIFEQ